MNMNMNSRLLKSATHLLFIIRVHGTARRLDARLRQLLLLLLT